MGGGVHQLGRLQIAIRREHGGADSHRWVDAQDGDGIEAAQAIDGAAKLIAGRPRLAVGLAARTVPQLIWATATARIESLRDVRHVTDALKSCRRPHL